MCRNYQKHSFLWDQVRSHRQSYDKIVETQCEFVFSSIYIFAVTDMCLFTRQLLLIGPSPDSQLRLLILLLYANQLAETRITLEIRSHHQSEHLATFTFLKFLFSSCDVPQMYQGQEPHVRKFKPCWETRRKHGCCQKRSHDLADFIVFKRSLHRSILFH